MQTSDLLTARNTLTQCMQDNAFQFTARIDAAAMKSGAHAGLAMFEENAGGIEIVQSGEQRRLSFFQAADHIGGPPVAQSILQLRVRVEGDQASYFYSLDDGHTFQQLGPVTRIGFSWWKGARPSLFAYTTESSEPGPVDIDWVRYEPMGENPR